uniref:synaptogyrin-3 isoform X1 n=1 Tax=Ictidomys tridecemlineatus TaxID=43179 RepID=UPI001A9DA7AE|nr:synaptogyrin-3 isoform X1 [Ictidomys tridecemlineatus]
MGTWRSILRECLQFGRGHASKGGRGGRKQGLRPRAWTWWGALARPRPARPRRGRRALPGGGSSGGGGGSSSSIRSISILGGSRGRPRAGPAGQTDRGCQGRGAAGASHGGRLVRRGPRGGRPGPRELCAAAPDPAAGRVLGEWPLPSLPLWSRAPPLHASEVFSIAVFGPIVNEGYVNSDSGPELRCVFNGNAGACRFGVALGLGAFLACAAFLVLDMRFQQISSVRDRRRAVLLDLGFSGLWAFLWFVGFCFLTNQWQRTAPGPGTVQAGDAARAAIAFSFFSILSWVALTVKALQRFRLGTDMSLFATEQLGSGAGQAYPGYPVGSGVEGTETYQSPPFTETLETSPKGYQVPAY